MKWGEMQILLDNKRSNCYYVFVVAKNMRYYVRPGLAKGLAGGGKGSRGAVMRDPCERCKEPLESPACRWCFYGPGIIEGMVEAPGASGHKNERKEDK